MAIESIRKNGTISTSLLRITQVPTRIHHYARFAEATNIAYERAVGRIQDSRTILNPSVMRRQRLAIETGWGQFPFAYRWGSRSVAISRFHTLSRFYTHKAKKIKNFLFHRFEELYKKRGALFRLLFCISKLCVMFSVFQVF